MSNTIYRKIWEDHYGEIPRDQNGRSYEIHHIDGNRSNNCIENLMCVSIEEHLNIHLNQNDYGAVQSILLRMENYDPEFFSECASKQQRKLLENGKHNFQKMSPERRSEISKKVHKEREVAFLGIENTVENSRRAGLKAAELKSGFLNTKSEKHGSKFVRGTKWWINVETGEKIRSKECPGDNWKKGMKL